VFQSLVGKLETRDCFRKSWDPLKFQSLVGKLETLVNNGDVPCGMRSFNPL